MFPLRDDRPTYSAPVVTVLLIVACALVFFFELSLDGYSRDYFINLYGIVPAHLRPITLLTSMFLHGGWMHIIGNMLFLWAFGKSLEDAMGHTKFLAFYLICGVAAGIAHDAFNLYTTVPTVGASGAIAGVMGAYLIKFPRARIHTLFVLVVFFTVADVPAFLILIYWFFTQLLSEYGSIATTQVGNGGVAYAAHIGGFVTGMILVQFMGVRSRYVPRRDIYW
jgi:membrane associated rhomboid family serine protease